MELKTITLKEFRENLNKYYKSNVVISDCPLFWDGTDPYKYYIRVGKRGGCHIEVSNGVKLPVTSISNYGIRHLFDTVIPCSDSIRRKVQTRLSSLDTAVRTLEKVLKSRTKNLKDLENLLSNYPELLI